MVKHKDRPSESTHQDFSIERGLVLYNDNVNDFDFVIKALIEVCDHNQEQAEQCTLIAHYKGKCNVRNGDYQEMKSMYDEMSLRGLTVAIE
jgi:ATP-dependent Clp protease adaptor protein ClpS